jgi:hypothetical protein
MQSVLKEKLMGRNRLKNLGVDARIILKIISKTRYFQVGK